MKAAILALLLAYIPSAGSLVRRAAERGREGSRSREVTLTGQLAVAGEAAKPAQLILRFPLACRFEGATSASVRGTADNPVAGANGGGPAQELLRLACPLIAYRSLSSADADKALRGTALAAGADVTAGGGLTRLVDRPAWVLGAGAHEPAKPQLWLYKDTAAPARLFTQGGEDLRLLQYGNPASADWFPRVLELWKGDQLLARFEAFETRGFRATGEGDDDE